MKGDRIKCRCLLSLTLHRWSSVVTCRHDRVVKTVFKHNTKWPTDLRTNEQKPIYCETTRLWYICWFQTLDHLSSWVQPLIELIMLKSLVPAPAPVYSSTPAWNSVTCGWWGLLLLGAFSCGVWERPGDGQTGFFLSAHLLLLELRLAPVVLLAAGGPYCRARGAVVLSTGLCGALRVLFNCFCSYVVG